VEEWKNARSVRIATQDEKGGILQWPPVCVTAGSGRIKTKLHRSDFKNACCAQKVEDKSDMSRLFWCTFSCVLCQVVPVEFERR